MNFKEDLFPCEENNLSAFNFLCEQHRTKRPVKSFCTLQHAASRQAAQAQFVCFCAFCCQNASRKQKKLFGKLTSTRRNIYRWVLCAVSGNIWKALSKKKKKKDVGKGRVIDCGRIALVCVCVRWGLGLEWGFHIEGGVAVDKSKWN